MPVIESRFARLFFLKINLSIDTSGWPLSWSSFYQESGLSLIIIIEVIRHLAFSIGDPGQRLDEPDVHLQVLPAGCSSTRRRPEAKSHRHGPWCA